MSLGEGGGEPYPCCPTQGRLGSIPRFPRGKTEERKSLHVPEPRLNYRLPPQNPDGTELFVLCDSYPRLLRHHIASCSSLLKDSNRWFRHCITRTSCVGRTPSGAWMFPAPPAFGSRVIGRKALLAHSTPKISRTHNPIGPSRSCTRFIQLE